MMGGVHGHCVLREPWVVLSAWIKEQCGRLGWKIYYKCKLGLGQQIYFVRLERASLDLIDEDHHSYYVQNFLLLRFTTNITK